MDTINLKEYRKVNGDDYSKFGKSYPDFPTEPDPVTCCLPGNFMTCHPTAQMGLCPEYMSQRCAQNWDDKCDLYLNSTPKIREFVLKTADKKFCKLAPNSACDIKCQPFNPIAQDSPQVCTYVGDETLIDPSRVEDIGYYWPVTISPYYMGKCERDCTMQSQIDINDPVIDNCLNYRLCADTLTSICKVMDNTKILHPGLKTFCDKLPPTWPSDPPTVSTSLFSISSTPSWNWCNIGWIIVLLICGYMGYRYYKRQS